MKKKKVGGATAPANVEFLLVVERATDSLPSTADMNRSWVKSRYQMTSD